MKTEPGFLLTNLVRLACEERDLLAAGSWEEALLIRDEYDQGFATFQRAVERGAQLGPQQRNDMARLHHVNAENLALYEDLRRNAGVELGAISKVSQIGGYAPMGPSGGHTPRYIDHSA